MPISPRFFGIASARTLIAFGLLLAYLTPARADSEPSDGERAIPLIGYTEGRNDLEGGQFVNWLTQRKPASS